MKHPLILHCPLPTLAFFSFALRPGQPAHSIPSTMTASQSTLLWHALRPPTKWRVVFVCCRAYHHDQSMRSAYHYHRCPIGFAFLQIRSMRVYKFHKQTFPFGILFLYLGPTRVRLFCPPTSVYAKPQLHKHTLAQTAAELRRYSIQNVYLMATRDTLQYVLYK